MSEWNAEHGLCRSDCTPVMRDRPARNEGYDPRRGYPRWLRRRGWLPRTLEPPRVQVSEQVQRHVAEAEDAVARVVA